MTEAKSVEIGSLRVSNAGPLTLIAGPCQLEGLDHALAIAEPLAEACAKAGAGFIFKASYDKANRTSLTAERGIGMDEGLRMLAEVRARIGCPVLTDVHLPDHCAPAAEAVDVLQIPAFLCRQTDLLLAAGATGAAINVKKGQFLAPWDMPNVAAKIASTGNERILLCERGSSFGYNTLVADMRSLPQMARTGYPVVMDATHSVQQPGGLGRRVGRAAGIRAGDGARGGGDRGGGGVHRDASRSRPRAVGRTEHDPARPDAGADRRVDGVRPIGQGAPARCLRV